MEVYEGSVDLGDFGTIAEQIGAKGSIDFSDKNFLSTKLNDKGERVRVVVIAKNEEGESAIVPTSGQLSAQLRKAKEAGATRKELLAQVMNLPIYGNEIGQFIGLPAGERREGLTIAELKKVKVTNKVTSPEELVW